MIPEPKKSITLDELRAFYRDRYTEYGGRWKKDKKQKKEVINPKPRRDVDFPPEEE